MTFSEDVLYRLAIFIIATAGFAVAYYIRHHKQNQKVLVCPLDMDCHGVVHSDYSTFLGLPVELLGMFYYGFISLSYLVFIFISDNLPNSLHGIMALLSIIAFIFSIYLLCVMLFVLKKGCYWCFVSATFCILIFIFTILSYDISSIREAFLV